MYYLVTKFYKRKFMTQLALGCEVLCLCNSLRYWLHELVNVMHVTFDMVIVVEKQEVL